MVQAESRVSCQVELLKLGGQIFRQSDLTQLVAAQIHALKTRGDVYIHVDTARSGAHSRSHAQCDARSRAAATVLLSSPSAA